MSEVGTTAHLLHQKPQSPPPIEPFGGEGWGERDQTSPTRNRSLPLPSGGGWGVGDQITAQRMLAQTDRVREAISSTLSDQNTCVRSCR